LQPSLRTAKYFVEGFANGYYFFAANGRQQHCTALKHPRSWLTLHAPAAKTSENYFSFFALMQRKKQRKIKKGMRYSPFLSLRHDSAFVQL
jgi:hypothetical protein